jgi:hypothetical protein
MNRYVQQIIDTKASKGGVVRRKAANVDKFKYRQPLVAWVKEEGFHMLECGGQVVIICSRDPLQLVAVQRTISN